MSRAVFLDLDGTLTDPKLGITRCIQYALAALDEPVPETHELTWAIGPPLQDTFAQLVGPQRAVKAVDLYRERFADIGLFENDPYPEIHATLAQLQGADLSLYVASSKPHVYVERILERYELADFFVEVYGSELDGRRTDKSQLLSYALNHSGVQAQHATMVGDRKHDALGAQNNDMAFVGVLYGYGDHGELTAAGVSTMVEHHSELLDVFNITL